jgi:hypothetical protein
MKISFFMLFAILFASCTKNSGVADLANPTVTVSPNKSESTSILLDDDDGKKYAPKLCSVNPKTLGTVCEDPGQKCKEYSCAGTIPNRATGRILSVKEINKYAQADVEALLKRGLIDPADVSYFKNLIVNGFNYSN